MRDYDELLTVLRACTSKDVGCMKCPRLTTKSFADDCAMSAVRDAADAIEELLRWRGAGLGTMCSAIEEVSKDA